MVSTTIACPETWRNKTVGQPPFSFKQSLQGVQNANASLQEYKQPLRGIGYVGPKSTHIPGCLEFNQAILASPEHPVRGETRNTNENIVQRLPFSGIAQGSYICQTTFDARYNSLETSATKRLSHGLQFLGSYTWSKNVDTTSGSGGLSNFELGFLTNDQTNQRQARGLDDFDRTHRVVLSLTYGPPALEVGPAILRNISSRWLLSSITVAESGIPVTVTVSNAGSVYGNLSGFSRAQCTGLRAQTSGSLYSRINGYLNPAAFT